MTWGCMLSSMKFSECPLPSSLYCQLSSKLASIGVRSHTAWPYTALHAQHTFTRQMVCDHFKATLVPITAMPSGMNMTLASRVRSIHFCICCGASGIDVEWTRQHLFANGGGSTLPGSKGVVICRDLFRTNTSQAFIHSGYKQHQKLLVNGRKQGHLQKALSRENLTGAISLMSDFQSWTVDCLQLLCSMLLLRHVGFWSWVV